MEKFNKDFEERIKVKSIQVDYKCPKCTKGYLRPVMMTHGSPDIQYPHHCNNNDCDYKMVLPQRYPYIEFVPEDWEIKLSYVNEENVTRNLKYNNEVTITDKTKIKTK